MRVYMRAKIGNYELAVSGPQQVVDKIMKEFINKAIIAKEIEKWRIKCKK